MSFDQQVWNLCKKISERTNYINSAAPKTTDG